MRFAICNLILLGLLNGCDTKSNGNSAAPAAKPQAEVVVSGNGVIRGTVKFIGTPPVMKEIANQPCHDGATSIREETVIVGADGGLKNVLVYLKDAPHVNGASAEPAVLDQINCQYVPHVIGVQVNQPLRVTTTDPTMHNVHYDPARNAPNNFGLTRPGMERTVTFKVAEFIKVRCDVHPWMNATIGVFDNPFFCATRADGSFEIAGLPPGDYVLAAWHERYGEMEQNVSVRDGQLNVKFEYREP